MCKPSADRRVTCFIKYVIDRDRVEEFETYAKMWIPLVNKFGGKHHGYLLPHEGADNIAYASFTFSSFATYEEYRASIRTDSASQKAFAFAKETRCIISSERTFLRPVFE
ncbi:MAG: NIPSNAP family protein [Bdellovibrionota bacterium]